MTNPDRSAIIYKPSGGGEKRGKAGESESVLRKKLLKKVKNLLTNPTESDIIIRSPQERGRAKGSESERSSKKLEKSLKNLLTKEAKCGRI